jgi:cation:H+ antiporter
MLDTIYIIVGLILLVLGGDWLLKSSVSISLKLNISKIVIGLTVVSFATSAPELIVSIKAALSGFPDIALGNVVGSNIANIGLVLAIVMLINPMKVDTTFLKTDWPAMLISSLLLYVVLLKDAMVSRTEGLIFLFLIGIFVFYIIKKQRTVSEIEISDEDNISGFKIVYLLIFGGLALWGGSELLVKGAVNVATLLGVSDRIIAVTVVSVGTSIPELAASIIAAVKKESSISIGNIIGSNIFNILSVLGITAMIMPIKVVDARLISFDMIWMLAFAFILLPMVLLPKKGYLERGSGVVLLIAYLGFVYLTFS